MTVSHTHGSGPEPAEVPEMPFVDRFDHVAVGVREVEQAALVFRDILGGEPVGGMEVPGEGFRFTQYRYPNRMKIELMEPLGRGGFLTRFLERRGEGVHHLSFRVTDLEARLDGLRSRGIEPVHVVLEGPWKEAFIHPRLAHGVLIQLLEVPSPKA
jgi:methylmalonyl-CoA/ethylmalonyl-CoA epimerase